MSRVLALDLGERRIGVAVSDPLGMVARPVGVIRRESKAADARRIADLLREHCAETLVVGHPVDADDLAGPQARRVQRYSAALQETLGHEGLRVRVVLWDEHGSTQRAQEMMLGPGHSARARRGELDALAAAVILQDYLEVHSWSR